MSIPHTGKLQYSMNKKHSYLLGCVLISQLWSLMFCNFLAQFAHSSLNLQLKHSGHDPTEHLWSKVSSVSKSVKARLLLHPHSLPWGNCSLQDPSVWKENQILALWLKKNKTPVKSVVHMHYIVLCFQSVISLDNRKFKTQQAQSTQAICSNTTRKFCWSRIPWTDNGTDFPIEAAFTHEFSSWEDKDTPGKWYDPL